MDFMTEDDIEMFFETWMQFDPTATQAIPYSRLSMFLDALKPPLRVPLPNQENIVALDVAISQRNTDGDDNATEVVHVDDAFEAVIKSVEKTYFEDTYGTHVEDVKVTTDLAFKFKRVSTTLQRRREEYCSTLAQESYRWVNPIHS